MTNAPRLAALVGAAMLAAAPAGAAPSNPVLYLTGVEHYSTDGGNFVRHHYDILNKHEYPAAMFAAAPGLPPCGSNANSSRSWVDFFDSGGKRLYGFCALGSSADLDSLWFATAESSVPPSTVYVEINDRQTGTKYKSNVADTTP